MFAIVVPFYNEEKYLPNLFKSLKSQKDNDFVVVFVNNLSSDKSVELFYEHKESNWYLVDCFEKGKVYTFAPAVKFIIDNFPEISYVANIDADTTFCTNSWTAGVNKILSDNSKLPVSFIYGPHEYTEIDGLGLFKDAERVDNDVLTNIMKNMYWYGFGHNVVYNLRLLSSAISNHGENSNFWLDDLRLALNLYYLDSYPIYSGSGVYTSGRRIVKSEATFDGFCFYERQKYLLYMTKGEHLNPSLTNELPSGLHTDEQVYKFFSKRSLKLVEQHILPILVYENNDKFFKSLKEYLSVSIDRGFIAKYRSRNDLIEILWDKNKYYSFINHITNSEEVGLITEAINNKMKELWTLRRNTL